MSMKNKLFTNFINNQDPKIKGISHTHYQNYWNLLFMLMKKTNQAYYDKYFERNWDNIKNIWTGIKSLISLKTLASSVPTVLFLYNGNINSNAYDIANTFDNHFAFIAETMKKNIKYSHKHFWGYLLIKVAVKYFCMTYW